MACACEYGVGDAGVTFASLLPFLWEKEGRSVACRFLSSSIHHDLHAVPWLDLGVLVEAVEDAEAFGGAVDAGHAVGERFHGVAGLRGDDLDAQGARGLDFFQRQAAERVYGLARIALALGVALLGDEDEAVDVAAVA